MEKLINKKIYGNHIFNICSNKPQNILDIVNKFRNNNKIDIKMTKIHKADVLKTHGNNNKIKKFLKYKNFSKFSTYFSKTFEWYKKNRMYNIG